MAQQRACQLFDEELQLRHLHCYAHLDQGIVVAHNGHDNLVQGNATKVHSLHCAYLLFSARELQELVAA